MSAESRDLITWTLGTLVSLSVLAGITVKFILLPWLRDHLLEPVRTTHQQVTENHHAGNDGPTLPDRMEDLHTDVRTLTRLLDSHITWSFREHRRLDRELRERLGIENGDGES